MGNKGVDCDLGFTNELPELIHRHWKAGEKISDGKRCDDEEQALVAGRPNPRA